MGSKVKVTRVIDGDTFVGKKGDEEKLYRLADVNTPENGETGFIKARTALERMIEGEDVTVVHKATGHYGRAIVDVKAGGKSINREMQKYGR